ncbi:MAG: DegT/DnrJ/EryC1/StrS family aminotransferase [Planctomycetaceae bacterium]
MIPLCDLKTQYQSLQSELDAAMTSVAASGHYILGEQVKQFEQEIAASLGCEYAIGVANGTDALHLALRALGIGPGDEVITTPFTFVATTEAIGILGATPVFVDIDPRTCNLDVSQLEGAITPRTKAVLPVHLYGQPCDMTGLMEIATRRGLRVVEDCCQAISAVYEGRQVGAIGDLGCFSFFPSKNLGCFGDGGLVTTNDRKLYETVEVLRRHGGAVKYHHSMLGLNSRLDEIQAAVLRVKLPHLEQWSQARRRIAYRYNEAFADLAGIARLGELDASGVSTPCPTSVHNPRLRAVYHQYTLMVDGRDELSAELKNRGVASFPYYPIPLHLQEVHAELGYRPGDFPHAERAAKQCLSLPIYPELTTDDQDRVIHHVRQAVTHMNQTRRSAA